MNNTQTAGHFNVFTVEEFDAPTKEDKDRKAKSWNKVGVAFPHKEGTGFNIQLRSLPVDGKLVVLPAEEKEAEEPAPAPSRDTRARR
jgi:hypothetical protein